MRIWQLDYYRGITLLFMLLFNWSFLLNYLGVMLITSPDNTLYWWLFPRLVVAAFAFISGIALYVSYKDDIWPFVRRSTLLLLCAALVTSVTYLLFPKEFIVFGILHFMAIAGLLAYLFIRYVKEAELLMLLGLMMILIGLYLEINYSTDDSLLVLGLRSPKYDSLDYEPLFPWFGFVLLGIAFAKTWKPKDVVANRTQKAVCWLGRNTLTIYLLHQPLLLLLLLLLGVKLH
jgi:uncharacterized membrane protein